MINRWGHYECGTCAAPVLRSEHASWCNQQGRGAGGFASELPVDVDRATTLYVNQGLSLTAVAARVGTTHDKLRRAFHHSGVALRPSGSQKRRSDGVDARYELPISEFAARHADPSGACASAGPGMARCVRLPHVGLCHGLGADGVVSWLR